MIYYKDARPVKNAMDPVHVHITLYLKEIFELDERKELLHANYFMVWSWSAYYAVWDPKDYANVKGLRMSNKDIWMPDITILNDVNPHFDKIIYDRNRIPAKVHHNGWIQYSEYIKLVTTCSVDVQAFPYDIQYCPINVGSWSFDDKKLTVEIFYPTTNHSLTYAVPNGGWHIHSLVNERYKQDYGVRTYERIKWTLCIERKPLYYLFNILLPCVFISYAGLFGVFLLPAESSEKIVLSATTLLVAIVFVMIIADVMPQSSDYVPLCAMYLQSTIVILVMSTFTSVVILAAHFNGKLNLEPPKWIKLVVLTFLKKVTFAGGLENDEFAQQRKTIFRRNLQNLMIAQKIRLNDQDPDLKTTEEEVHKLEVEKFHMKGELLEDWEKHRREWMLISIILDRLFFVLFVISTVLMTVIIYSYRVFYIDTRGVDIDPMTTTVEPADTFEYEDYDYLHLEETISVNLTNHTFSYDMY